MQKKKSLYHLHYRLKFKTKKENLTFTYTLIHISNTKGKKSDKSEKVTKVEKKYKELIRNFFIIILFHRCYCRRRLQGSLQKPKPDSIRVWTRLKSE